MSEMQLQKNGTEHETNQEDTALRHMQKESAGTKMRFSCTYLRVKMNRYKPRFTRFSDKYRKLIHEFLYSL